MAHWAWRLRWALAALLVCACTGAVLGAQANCTGSAELITQVSGKCDRTIDSLDEAETQNIAVQTMDIAPFADVSFNVSVERGTVLVKFTNSRGNEESFEASPGRSASGRVTVQLDPFNQIKFDLEPVGGPAEGVEYHLEFVCDCLP